MSAVLVPWCASCWVLILAGVAKLRRPDPTVGALAAAGLPSARPAVLALALGEIVLGAAGATGHRLAGAGVAVAYVGFAAFVALALHRGGDLQQCGCFGTEDVPASRLHLVVDLAAATVAVAVAVAGVPSVASVLDQGAAGAATLGLAGLATAQVVVALTTLPRVLAERRRVEAAFGW